MIVHLLLLVAAATPASPASPAQAKAEQTARAPVALATAQKPAAATVAPAPVAVAPAPKPAAATTAQKPAALPPAPPPATPARPSAPRIPFESVEVIVGNEKVSVAVHTPSSADATSPLLLVLAPSSMSPTDILELLSADRWGREARAIVAALGVPTDRDPSAVGSWARAAIAQVGPRHLRSETTWVVAFGEGGRAAQDLVCNTPHLITAAAFVSYAWSMDTCTPAFAPPVALIQSKADPAQPFNGDEAKKRRSYKQVVALLEGRVVGPAKVTSVFEVKDGRCLRRVAREVEVLGCTLDWGGTTYPGSSAKLPAAWGPTYPGLDTNATLSDFFRRASADFLSVVHAH